MEDWLPYVWIVVVAGLAIGFYLRSRASRRGLRCTQCNEYMRVELMSTDQRCNVCGAPMQMTEETHAQS